MNRRTTLVIPILALAAATAFAATHQTAPSETAAPLSPGKRVPAGTTEEVREAVVGLHRLAGFDPARDLLTLPYQETTIDALAEAAEDPAFEVRSTALHLLALAVRQLELPDEALHGRILPRVREVAAPGEPPGSPEEARRMVELARRILWHAEIRELKDPGQRLEALAAALDDLRDGYYYPLEALSYLADTGTPEARALLAAKLAESERRSVSPKLVAHVQVTARKVDLQIQLRTVGSEARVEAMTDALIASLPDRSLPARDFQTWILRQLGEQRDQLSRQVLARLAADEALRRDLRYEAEQELQEMVRGGIPREQ